MGVAEEAGQRITRQGAGGGEVSDMETARPRGTDSAKVIFVIETRSLLGKGTEDDPCRELIQYWDLFGKLLAEHDPFSETLADEQS